MSLTYLSDEEVTEIIDTYFIDKLGEQRYQEYKSHIYGIEFPRFEAVLNGTEDILYTSDTSNVTQYIPALCKGMGDKVLGPYSEEDNFNNLGFYSDNSGYFKKLLDNEGRKAVFVEYGTGKQDIEKRLQDEYVNLPFFTDIPVKFVRDEYGFRRVANEGDDGILALSYWVKIEDTYNQEDYPESLYPDYYSDNTQTKGYPVTRIYVSSQCPEDSEGWEFCSAGTHYDGSYSPYVVRCPYLAGKKELSKGLELYSCRGCYSEPNMSARNAQYIAKYKGEGYTGSSAEYYSWILLNMLLKYGTKSSKLLANGSELKDAAILDVFKTSLDENKTIFYVKEEDFENSSLGVGSCIALRTNKEDVWGDFTLNSLENLNNNSKRANTLIVYAIEDVEIDKVRLKSIILKQLDDNLDELLDVRVESEEQIYIMPMTSGTTAGITNLIDIELKDEVSNDGFDSPLYLDGCLGSAKSPYSPYRIRMIELGMGQSDIVGDMFAIKSNKYNRNKLGVYMFPKEKIDYMERLKSSNSFNGRRSAVLLKESPIDFDSTSILECTFKLGDKTQKIRKRNVIIDGCVYPNDWTKCGTYNSLNPISEVGYNNNFNISNSDESSLGIAFSGSALDSKGGVMSMNITNTFIKMNKTASTRL